ncbi:hypothetical protein FQR65_LT07579 [Abscondita terminalis]|nr:hypothetical protein FQR65_LT07579 [Abscondita terminalis]
MCMVTRLGFVRVGVKPERGLTKSDVTQSAGGFSSSLALHHDQALPFECFFARENLKEMATEVENNVPAPTETKEIKEEIPIDNKTEETKQEAAAGDAPVAAVKEPAPPKV